MDALTEIADLARMLSQSLPEAGKRLKDDRETALECRNDEGLREHLFDAQHNATEAAKQCHVLRQELNRLAKLVYENMPQVELHHCRLNSTWELDTAETDWTEIVSELQRIEDSALRRIAPWDGDAVKHDIADTRHLALGSVIENGLASVLNAADKLKAHEIAAAAIVEIIRQDKREASTSQDDWVVRLGRGKGTINEAMKSVVKSKEYQEAISVPVLSDTVKNILSAKKT